MYVKYIIISCIKLISINGLLLHILNPIIYLFKGRN